MEKLNELVEQAKFVADWHGSDWSSALCQDKDGKQAHEIICESRGEAVISTGSNSNEASWLCDYLELCSPANILAIAEGFRAMNQQRDALAAGCGLSVQSADLKALMRFNETSDDGEGYDIGDHAMSRLVELGLVAKERGKMRIITSFGMWVIARENGEQTGVLETQRDRDLAFQKRLAHLRAGKDGE